MWDLPGPGLEPVYSALAGGLLTTVPPGKPSYGGNLMNVFNVYPLQLDIMYLGIGPDFHQPTQVSTYQVFKKYLFHYP